jgi:hypothetical protein
MGTLHLYATSQQYVCSFIAVEFYMLTANRSLGLYLLTTLVILSLVLGPLPQPTMEKLLHLIYSINIAHSHPYSSSMRCGSVAFALSDPLNP